MNSQNWIGTGEETISGSSAAGSGRMIDGRYKLLKPIGKGASAVTWRARDTRLDRIVALKVLVPALAADPVYGERFLQEARIAASVSHPNVVTVYDTGRDGDQLYIVMEYIEGNDLKHLIQRVGRLAPNQAVALAQQILDGLSAVHTAKIIHCDIKPHNVLIDKTGAARVTDFGIAHIAASGSLTGAGSVAGTPAYMAPEQVEGKRVSKATDIYVAGVVLYEMLTGELPFMGPSSEAFMNAHVNDPVTPPSRVAPAAAIPPALDTIVLRAMAKRADRRFQSAEEMRAALDRAISGKAARPDPVDQRTVVDPKPVTTRPARTAPDKAAAKGGSFASGLLVGVLVIAMLAGAGWYFLNNGYPFSADGRGVDQEVPAGAGSSATAPLVLSAESTATTVPTPTQPAAESTEAPTAPPTSAVTSVEVVPATQMPIMPSTQREITSPIQPMIVPPAEDVVMSATQPMIMPPDQDGGNDILIVPGG